LQETFMKEEPFLVIQKVAKDYWTKWKLFRLIKFCIVFMLHSWIYTCSGNYRIFLIQYIPRIYSLKQNAGYLLYTGYLILINQSIFFQIINDAKKCFSSKWNDFSRI
jgi:hypothetical protein